LRVDDDALELCCSGEEIRAEFGEMLPEFADASRRKLAAVLAAHQLDNDLAEVPVDPCGTGE
jgi:hypothetical protein